MLYTLKLNSKSFIVFCICVIRLGCCKISKEYSKPIWSYKHFCEMTPKMFLEKLTLSQYIKCQLRDFSKSENCYNFSFNWPTEMVFTILKLANKGLHDETKSILTYCFLCQKFPKNGQKCYEKSSKLKTYPHLQNGCHWKNCC